MPSFFKIKSFKKKWTVFIIPFTFWLIDIIYRSRQLQDFNKWQLLFYIVSLFVSAGYIILIFLLLRKFSKRNWLFYVFSSLTIPIWLFSFFGSYKYEMMNGVYPSYFTFLFIRNEPYSAYVLATHNIKIWALILVIVALIVLFVCLKKTIHQFVPVIKTKFILLYVGAQLIVFEGMFLIQEKYDQCAIADVNFALNFQRLLLDFNDYSRIGGGLKKRNPKEIQLEISNLKTPDYNIILVIFESARKRSMGLYNPSVNTTPFLNSFEKKYPRSFIKFQEPKTIATSTMLAVPSILSGIGPYQSEGIMFSQPLVWEFAKKVGYKTFFLSSHGLGMFNFKDFYAKNDLDFYYYQENSGHPLFNELGMDDIWATEKLIEKLSDYKQDRFFGVIQYNTTHYPYTVPDNYMKWGDDKIIDNYYNAMYYQDQLLKKVLNHMSDEKLLDNTIILFVSDHAEAIEEHQNIGHLESNYIETIDIPLMMYIPNNVLSAKKDSTVRENINRLCSNIDITPTIIDLLGIKNDSLSKHLYKNYTGYSLLDPLPEDRFVITLNSNSWGNFTTGISIINSKWHYLFRTNIVPNKEEIYLWKSDPSESQDYSFTISDSLRISIAREFEKYPESHRFGNRVRNKIFFDN